MSKIKFKREIEELIRNRSHIPDEFWVRTSENKYRVIWFLNRQRPSIEADYDFDEERFGLVSNGDIIWGFDSGCSCPSAWSAEDYGDDRYSTKTWKEFYVSPDTAFDADWQDECYENLMAYLLLIRTDVSAKEVLGVKNSEIRRYLIKRIGYENIKNDVKATVVHCDGSNELLRFFSGELYVKVQDSSTDREYLIYVDGDHKTCKSAIAWTFGLRENEYNPIVET